MTESFLYFGRRLQKAGRCSGIHSAATVLKQTNMSNAFELFRKLHQQEKPLLLGNVWDAQSAKAFEKLKYQAIGTSSAAVAEALGYEDGENMPFDEYLFVVKRIKEST